MDGATFICKLRPSDGTPQYCTYLDIAGTVLGAADTAGEVSVVAESGSGGQASAGSLSLGKQIYSAKLNPTGTALVYAATFGGSVADRVGGTAIDAAGDVYITGWTNSGDFPTTSDAVVRTFQPQVGQQFVSFTAALDAAGTAFLYSTLGSLNEQSDGIVLDPNGNVQVMEHDTARNFTVRRYNGNGSGILFETALHVAFDPGLGEFPQMAIDSAGVTTVLGFTSSISIPAIQSVQSCQLTNIRPGYAEGFLIRLAADGKMIESSYLPAAPGLPLLFVNGTIGLSSGRELVWSEIDSPQNQSAAELDLLTLAPASSAVPVRLSCVGNAATFTGAPLAPDEIVSLFGTGIGPGDPVVPQPGPDQRFPTLLANTLGDRKRSACAAAVCQQYADQRGHSLWLVAERDESDMCRLRGRCHQLHRGGVACGCARDLSELLGNLPDRLGGSGGCAESGRNGEFSAEPRVSRIRHFTFGNWTGACHADPAGRWSEPGSRCCAEPAGAGSGSQSVH